ncbi:MAG: Lrp/AsnC family transcriptional regulator [Bryobacteraceae bacterium]
MTEEPKRLLDDIGWKILVEMQQNARITFAELGRKVGLSTAAVVERVHKLEDAGIIEGYRTEVNCAKIGFPIMAFIRISVVGEFLERVKTVARDLPEVRECHRVTGTDTFIIKVCVSSVDHLESVIDHLTPYVATTTSIVLSSAITKRIVEPAPGTKEKKTHIYAGQFAAAQGR